MKRIYFLLVGLLILTGFANAQDQFQKKVFINGNDTLPYRLLLPLDYDANKAYPLLIFLHGAGERGNDNEKQLVHGAKMFLVDSVRKNYPAIVVFPQCSTTSFWASIGFTIDSVTKKRSISFNADNKPSAAMKSLMALYKQLHKDHKIDKDRQYAGGLSMGAMGTFELVNRLPDTFAAAFAICGGGDTSTVEKLKPTAWWIFHGLEDAVVDPQFSKDMAAALEQNGAEVKLSLYPAVNHNSWDNAFKEPDFFSWIFSHKK